MSTNTFYSNVHHVHRSKGISIAKSNCSAFQFGCVVKGNVVICFRQLIEIRRGQYGLCTLSCFLRGLGQENDSAFPCVFILYQVLGNFQPSRHVKVMSTGMHAHNRFVGFNGCSWRERRTRFLNDGQGIHVSSVHDHRAFSVVIYSCKGMKS